MFAISHFESGMLLILSIALIVLAITWLVPALPRGSRLVARECASILAAAVIAFWVLALIL